MVSKKEQGEYFKKILNKGFSNSLVKERPKDYEELMELFKKHPEYPYKLRDVVDIMVGKNTRNPKYYAFNIIRQDGSIEDISYIKCINPPNDKHNLLSAMRKAIQPQINDFRHKSKKECEFCKKTNDISIDHIYMFKYLVRDFLALTDKMDIPNDFDDDTDHIAIFKKKDIEFHNKWFTYHLNNATLRPLCTKCNLSRSKI
tara:strand:+ start:142 stop:744 length:603 start_codon:yes stop_codon:yes gene_type:complete